MSLFPTVFTLRNTWVHVSTMNCSDVASNVEVSIDETFGFETTLNVSNIEPYNGYIQFRRDFDNFWPRCNIL